jgi:glycosyltransferase involved in cell wall biosynthesis
MKRGILFVIDNLQFGGGERVFSQIINGLKPSDYNIFIASLPGVDFYKAITNKHVQFLPLDFSKRINPALIFKLAEIIKKNEIDIVHGQGTRAEFYARIAKRLAGRARYVSTIAMPVEGFDVSPFRKKIYRFFDILSERYVDRFIVVSNVLRDMMINKRGINTDKVFRIYNGIEIDKYNPTLEDRVHIRKELGVDEDIILIGAIGRLVWQKGFEYLIQSIPDVIKVYPNVKFMIVGNGKLKEELKAQSSKLKVKDYLIFTGFRNDIKEILSAIDILVIPSLLEGFPMITLEGMAMSKPIIATRIEGITEQITDEETGLLVPSRDADALTKAINRLINDRDLALRLGMNSRQKVQKEFSVQKMVMETEKIYQDLIATKKISSLK